MRFMIIGKATAESEKVGALPDPQLMAEMGDFNEELVKAGVLLSSDGLHPSSKGARVKFSGKTVPSSTAPSPNPRNSSPASRSGRLNPSQRPSSGLSAAPNSQAADSEVEIRQVYEMEDFDPSCRKSRSRTK